MEKPRKVRKVYNFGAVSGRGLDLDGVVACGYAIIDGVSALRGVHAERVGAGRADVPDRCWGPFLSSAAPTGEARFVDNRHRRTLPACVRPWCSFC